MLLDANRPMSQERESELEFVHQHASVSAVRRAQRIRRHLLFSLLSLCIVATIYWWLEGEPGVFRLSMGTAYASAAFFCVAMILGPLNILRGRRNPTNQYLRRDVGIWAGILGLSHVAFGLQVHMRGKFWLYFVFPADQLHLLPLRYDPFGLANYTGLAATLVLVLLLGLSNNFSLRSLGGVRWKRFQRATYAAAGLTVVHGVVYQLLETRKAIFVVLFFAMIVLVAMFQMLAFRRIRR